jgi:hypothetical protein
MNIQQYDTPEWRALRDEVLAEAKYKCAICGNRAWTAHHVHYRNGILDKDALVALCWNCHHAVHESPSQCTRCGQELWIEDFDHHGQHVGWYRENLLYESLCTYCAHVLEL